MTPEYAQNVMAQVMILKTMRCHAGYAGANASFSRVRSISLDNIRQDLHVAERKSYFACMRHTANLPG